MPYYQILGQDNLKRIVKATKPAVALTSVSASVVGANPPISELLNVDFTLYNKTYLNTYVIRSEGVRYFVSAGTQQESLSIFLSQYGVEPASNRLAVGYNFDLVDGNKKPIGPNVHFGDPSSDYTEPAMDLIMADMIYCGFNSNRNGYKQIYGNDLFAPDGNKFDLWLDKCIANNISTLVNVSMSFAAIDPVVQTSNWINDIDSSGYSAAQYVSIEAGGYNKGRNFALRYQSKLKYWEGIMMGSELDVIDVHTKKKAAGSGTGMPALGIFDSASNTYIWTSSYAGTVSPANMIFPMNYFGAYLYSMAGFIKGVWSVDASVDFSINFSEKHYGLPSIFFTELKRICGIDVANRMFVGMDIYSDVENATDITGSFVSKTIAPNGVAQSMSAIARGLFYFVNKGLAREPWIVEQGYNISKASIWPSQDLFFKNTSIPYWKMPDCGGMYIYEAIDEPITRASSVIAEQKFGLTKASKDMFRLELLGLPPIP